MINGFLLPVIVYVTFQYFTVPIRAPQNGVQVEEEVENPNLKVIL